MLLLLLLVVRVWSCVGAAQVLRAGSAIHPFCGANHRFRHQRTVDPWVNHGISSSASYSPCARALVQRGEEGRLGMGVWALVARVWLVDMVDTQMNDQLS